MRGWAIAVMAIAPVAVAHADDDTAAREPLLPTLDRIGPSSQLDLELGFLHGGPPGDEELLRSAIDASILVAPTYGFYTQLPLSAAPNAADRQFAIGGFEVGAFYAARHVAGHDVVLVPHLGGVLPTGSIGDGVLLNSATTPLHPNDFALIYPRAFAVRAGATLQYRTEHVVVRVDLGLDYPIRSDGRTSPFATSYKLDVGAGYDTGEIVVGLTSTNFVTGDERLDSVAASIAASSVEMRTHPYFAIVRPLQGPTTIGAIAGLAVRL